MKYLIWLAESGLQPEKSIALLNHYGSAEQVFSAGDEEIKQLLQTDKLPKKGFEKRDTAPADMILGECARLGVEIISVFDSRYPDRLRNIFDPPVVIYIKGAFPEFNEMPTIAVVGHRNATPYGVLVAEKLGYHLSKNGFIVVSGLAKGIDAAAHRGALKGSTPTVAVFGTAIDICYPAENIPLYRNVLRDGAVISEYPPGKEGGPAYFPRRNRIISGLSLGTVVVEAGMRSGSLITANLALDQGRDVFAVPGSVEAEASRGTNDLIKHGARLVTDAYDIIAEYGDIYGITLAAAAEEPLSEEQSQPAPKGIGGAIDSAQGITEKAPAYDDPVLAAIGSESNIEQIMANCELMEHEILSRLTLLELEGKIKQLPNRSFKIIC